MDDACAICASKIWIIAEIIAENTADNSPYCSRCWGPVVIDTGEYPVPFVCLWTAEEMLV